MNENSGKTEFESVEPALDVAIQVVLAESVPNDAVQRVKVRAMRLGEPTVSSGVTRQQNRVWLTPWTYGGGIAAALLILATLAISSLFVDRTAVRAFADVIQNVQQVHSVQFTIATRLGRRPEILGKMYLQGPRARLEQSLESPGMLIQIADFSRKRAVFLDPDRKLAQSIEMDEPSVKHFANPIDQLRRARPDDAERLGEEFLAGRRTQVYRLHEVDLLGIQGAAEMLVWVDPQDGLPVRIAVHDPDPKSEIRIRFEDFVWGESLDASLFVLEVPEGYQLGHVVTLPRGAASAVPSEPLSVTPSQLSQGFLSRDRVPGRIVWGPRGTTLTATLRDAESVAVQDRRSDELRQWTVADGTLKWSVELGGSFSLAAAPDGTSLATVEGYELQLRDPATGLVKQKWSTEKRLLPLAFSPDGKTLAAGIAEWGRSTSGRVPSGGVQFWDVEHGRLIRTVSDDKPTTFVRYSADGKYLANAPNGGPVKVWAAETGRLLRVFPYGGKFDFSPNGQQIACMASQPIEGDTPDDVREQYDVQIYDVQSGKLVTTLLSDQHTPESYVLWIEFSPDGRHIVVANWDGTVKLWEVASSRLVNTIREHGDGVGTCVFAPQGDVLATGGEDKMLRLWGLDQLVAE